MNHGQFEITFYKSKERWQEIFGIKEQAINFARHLLEKGYYPVVVYDKFNQEWVDLE